MASTEVELLCEFYDALARRDYEQLRAAVHPDFMMEISDELPWGGVRYGPDGFLAFVSDLFSSIDPVLEIGELFDAGDLIVQIGYLAGTVISDGTPFRARMIHIWQLRDELIFFHRGYVDMPLMLAALEGGHGANGTLVRIECANVPFAPEGSGGITSHACGADTMAS